MSIKILHGIVIKGLCFLAILMPVCAQSTTANALQHPRDQIALQLGAIQMGYTTAGTAFQLVTGNATNAQQAANALVMGRNALDATVAKPAVKVQGAINSPAVDTVEYRDQLYSAVEHVVTSPAAGAIRGMVTFEGGKKVAALARLVAPPNSWTVPVPYALEARSSADAQALRDELVAAGVLSDGGGGNSTVEVVTVAGGTLSQGSQLAGQQVATFQIGKYEVTWGEWKSVREWALSNGYTDLAGVGAGSGDNHPVESVSWYDVVKWCNAKSEKGGLTPVYQANGATFKSGQIEPTINSAANGYRLPTDAEWDWAARGGVLSQGFTYSGSNDVDAVAWYIYNSGSTTHEIGTKASNELGIFDMSGNAWEWVFDAYDGSLRRVRGTGFGNHEDSAAVANRDGRANPDYRYYDGGRNGVGFRLVRNAGN